MPLAPGKTLGPYEILSPIGAGGMGEVYKARDTRLDRTVAIKVLTPDLTRDETASRWGLLEHLAARLIAHHRGRIVTVGLDDRL